MFDYCHDLTRINMVYVPFAKDEVDIQLADIINNTDKFNFEHRSSEIVNKAKMLFVRESEGIYTYCKKKVFMKIEGDHLVIRVGGGYMSLEQFIDSFNPF